jgi:hypothetical protein
VVSIQSDIQLGGSYDDHPSVTPALEPEAQDQLQPNPDMQNELHQTTDEQPSRKGKSVVISGRQLLIAIVLVEFVEFSAFINLPLFFGALAIGVVGFWFTFFHKPRQRPQSTDP